MAPASDKHDAYKTHQSKQLTDREIEARALLSCANQLDLAAKPESERKFYDEALKRNQRLWTIFQVALCDPGNPLPHELKNILLNLSCYVDKVSFRALAEYKPALLTSLIDINRSIAAGLSNRKAGESYPASAATAPVAISPASSVMTSA